MSRRWWNVANQKFKIQNRMFLADRSTNGRAYATVIASVRLSVVKYCV